MKNLAAEMFYILTPRLSCEPRALQEDRVLGPFASHRDAWLARCAWAYDAEDVPDRAELLTGVELHADYRRRYGSVPLSVTA